MCDKISYQIVSTLAVNQAAFYHLKFAKIIIKKKTLAPVVASKVEMRFLN